VARLPARRREPHLGELRAQPLAQDDGTIQRVLRESRHRRTAWRGFRHGRIALQSLARWLLSHSCSYSRARTVARTVVMRLPPHTQVACSWFKHRLARTVARTVALAQSRSHGCSHGSMRLPPHTQVACSWFKHRLARTVARTVALAQSRSRRCLISTLSCVPACTPIKKELQSSKCPFIVHVTRVRSAESAPKMQAAAVRQTSELCQAAAQHEKLVLTCTCKQLDSCLGRPREGRRRMVDEQQGFLGTSSPA
jgi:hypothetical protein